MGSGHRARWVSSQAALFASCSLAVLAASSASAQESAQPDAEAPAPQQEAEDDEDGRRILVIGHRIIYAPLENVPVEQTYDEDRVSSYDVSTVGELLEQVRSENGDEESSFLVNGQPIRDFEDISDLPVEAVERIEALPRGSAQLTGGVAGQRTYNVVLRRSVQSATLTGSRELASEGGWSNTRGEALLTYIAGQDRVNVTLRAADSDPLFEADRAFTPRVPSSPFSPIGNIVPASGTQVDPLLSALAGQPVIVVALPEGTATPTLASLLPGTNRVNPSNESLYRSLRGEVRTYELAVAGNKTLTPWLSLSFNGRVNWNKSENFRGLPAARFLISVTNPSSPFSVPVYLALNDPDRPLRSGSDGTTGSLGATLNGNFEQWRASLGARYDERESTFLSQFTGASLITVDPATNPFGGTLAGSIPVSSRTSYSKTITRQITGEAEGPLIHLWAGPVQVRLGLNAAWVSFDATDTFGPRTFRRHEYATKAGVTIPLTGSDPAFLSSLGESDFAIDYGTVDLGRYGTLERHSLALNWQPLPWLRFVASEVSDEHAISPELFAAPQVITPNVPYFDPQTGQTVDVTTIYGGAGAITNDKLRTRTLALTATPLAKYNLQLNAEYAVTDYTNQIGALPPPSAAVVAAFPDRFVRDSSGTLVLVDNRSVNFERQHNERLRLSVGFTLPITQTVTLPANRETGAPARRTPGLRLQVNASHTFLLESTTVIRAGLPEIDLLEGGAIGIGGSGQRHATDLAVALTQGGSGVRLNLQSRGRSFLTTGTAAVPNRLTFDPITTVDIRAFLELEQVLPGNKLAKGARLSLVFDNILNERQRVGDILGLTPQAYQPAFRDPIGRTVMFEIRKVF